MLGLALRTGCESQLRNMLCSARWPWENSHVRFLFQPPRLHWFDSRLARWEIDRPRRAVGAQRPIIMDRDALIFWLTVASALCWLVCFWWMHCISKRQDAMLSELREQTCRIEQLSKAEHDLIREVHPQVNEIMDKIERVESRVIDD